VEKDDRRKWMIRFIASDLDGTLLQNGAQSLEPEVFDLIRKLQDKGILFAAASGRQYLNLRHLFAPLRSEMMFIAENGALVMYKDQLIHQTVLPRDLTIELMRDICAQENCEVVLSGQFTCYIMPSEHKEFSDHMLYEVKNTVTIVDDIFSVQEDYLKVSLYSNDYVSDKIAPYFRDKWSDYFSVAVSGKQWVDFTLGNKGAAVRMVQDELKLERNEMMAFGDNFNDEYMLQAVKYGFAMENASDEVRGMAKYHCRRVEDVLKQVLEGKFD